ncbi:MAG: hypothetical protein PHQ82_03550 [Bacteroidales bacterium]|nr:hypothetical protein [Bacteroidales bacterium]
MVLIIFKYCGNGSLGIALCHYFQSHNPIPSDTYKGWKNFIAKNADRIIP